MKNIYTIELTFHTRFNVLAESRSEAIRMFVNHQINKGRFNYDVFVIDGLLNKAVYQLSNGEKYYVHKFEVIE